MKRFLIATAVIVAVFFSGVFAYRLAAPEIVVVNRSDVVIEEITIELPSSRVAFGAVPPGAKSTIYYSASQADGAYRYAVRLAGAGTHAASCGSVRDGDYGKRLRLVVRGAGSVECEESRKLF